MVVRTNLPALNAHRHMLLHQKHVSKAMTRLSSGYRINSAADDAAGLAVSEKMRGQIRGLRMASRNAQDSISMLQTAEGGLNELHGILQRMRELTVQAANGTYRDEDRELLNREYQQLKEEIDRIAGYTAYNEIRLLDGSAGGKTGAAAMRELGISEGDFTITGNFADDFRLIIQQTDDGSFHITLKSGDKSVTNIVPSSASGTNFDFDLGDGKIITLNLTHAALKEGVVSNLQVHNGQVVAAQAVTGTGSSRLVFQIGANGTADQRLSANISDMSTSSLGDLNALLLQDTNILTRENANAARNVIDQAIRQVSSARADIGAQINRLEHTIRNLDNSVENLAAAESAIRDADMAEEMMNYMKHSIMIQVAQAMLAQANQLPNIILQMLNSL